MRSSGRLCGKIREKFFIRQKPPFIPGAVYPETEPLAQRPELLLLDLDEEESLVEQLRMTPGELEAEMTGQRILRMVGKEEIFDKTTGGMRKVEFKDIVILFRSPAAFR